MSDTVIKVENLSKIYQLGTIGTGTLTKDLNLWWHKMRGKPNPYAKIDQNNHFEQASEHWALRDVSFEIKQGDAVGIIGRNGAGKSTLLKILSRITTPTAGNIKIKGRIASLLEVGTGFNGELSGRENIYLNGAILGMNKAYINSKLDEIIDFSGVEKYIDTPVKRYSSGMYVRLAFAVAAHLEPEILIVDEVLAVGDAEFQKKCLGKMNDVSQKEGRTVLFVSHDMQAISTITQESILLKEGITIFKGDTTRAIVEYLNLTKTKELVFEDYTISEKPKISRVKIVTTLENNIQYNSEKMIIEIEIFIPFPIFETCLSIHIMNSREKPQLHLWNYRIENVLFSKPGVSKIICTIPNLKLFMGNYYLDVYIAQPPGGEIYQILKNVCPFEVVMHGKYREYAWQPEETSYIEEANWTYS